MWENFTMWAYLFKDQANRSHSIWFLFLNYLSVVPGAATVIIMVCVGFLVVMVILGVFRIRSIHRRGEGARSGSKEGSGQWDDSALTIIVNPMEVQKRNKTKQSLNVELSKNLLSSIFPRSRPFSRTVLWVSHGHLCRHGGRRGGGRGSGGVTGRRQRRPADHHQEGGEGQQHPSLLSHMLSPRWVS